MKITHVGPMNGPERRRRAGAAGGRSSVPFAPATADDAGPGSEIAASAPLGVLGAVLALQEVPDPTAARRQALARGHGLLDELDQLQLGLVEGHLSEATLRRLTHLLESRPAATSDRRLDAVLEAIELRAAVELAKLEQAQPRARPAP